MPAVSIVIPCYNLGAYLQDTVKSVLDQTYQDFEILIVDDGSNDSMTLDLLASYHPPRTRIIRTENRGLAEARNIGLRESSGCYLSFLDADDLLMPTFLERTVATLEVHPSVAFASCWLIAFGDAEFEWKPNRCDFPHLLAEDTVCTAALTRREALLAVGGYDSRMPIAGYEDWELAISLVESGSRGIIIPDFLFRYRIRAGSMTASCTAPHNHARLMAYLVDKHASTYQRHYTGVVKVIGERLAALERVIPNPPVRPAIPIEMRPGDEATWRDSLLMLENHRRNLEVVVQDETPAQEGAFDPETPAMVKIVEVRREPGDAQRLVGHHIDVPKPGSQVDAHRFEVIGWALGREQAVIAVELLYEEIVFQRVAPGVVRPDLASAFPHAEGAGHAGFVARFSLLTTALAFEIRLRAIFEDETSCDIGLVRGEHCRQDSLLAKFALVSVVISYEDAISAITLEGVLFQRYPKLEVILVRDVASGWQANMTVGHPGMHYLCVEHPYRHAWREAGMAQATGAYICLMDRGEQVVPNFIERAVQYLDRDPTVAFVVARLVTGQASEGVRRCDLLDLLSGNAMGAQILFRTSALKDACVLDNSISALAIAQWDLCITLVQQGLAGVILTIADARASAPSRLSEMELNSIHYVYDKHAESYNLHLIDVLLRQEEEVCNLLRQNYELERYANTSLQPQITSREEELRFLTDKQERRYRLSVSDEEYVREPLNAINWGDFNRLTPVSSLWGADRGMCIDRYYIEQFLESHASDIQGVVLEVHDSIYTWRYGGSRVRRADVIDINPLNPAATIVADLSHAPGIPSQTYDCIILTQTLCLIYDFQRALSECRRILKPGGVLLATEPCLNRIDIDAGYDGDYWRFTPAAVHRLFCEFFPETLVDTNPHGNLPASFAFLEGLAAHEIGATELDILDVRFPLTVTVRAIAPVQ